MLVHRLHEDNLQVTQFIVKVILIKINWFFLCSCEKWNLQFLSYLHGSLWIFEDLIQLIDDTLAEYFVLVLSKHLHGG